MRAEAELVELEATLRELVETRARCAELVIERRRLLKAVHAAGVPKTGPNGVGATVRRFLESKGWRAEDIAAKETGVSDQTVRGDIERTG